MATRKLLDWRDENFRVLLEVIDAGGGLHDYGISRQAWHRAVNFIKHYGPDRALEVIDQRAERAADRRDFETSRRWRELIVAIHALQEEEQLPGDNIH